MNAKLITIDGEAKGIRPRDVKMGFSLAELCALIGCEQIQILEISGDRLLIVDEEAQRPNPVATIELALEDTLEIPNGGLRGDVIICDSWLLN